MDFGKKQTAIFYIDTNKAFYAQETTVLEIDFPPDVVSDLEVVNKEILEQMLSSFIKNNGLPPGEIVLVFATSVLFEKDLGEDLQRETDAETQRFLELVPFDDVFSKTYKINKKTKVVAVNKRLYETIKIVFEKNDFSILAVTPFSLLQESVPELANNVDFVFMTGKIDLIRQYSMVAEIQTSIQNKEKNKNPQNKNIRLYVFIGIFAVLVLILIILVITTLQPSPVPPPTKVLPQVLPKVTTVPTVSTSTSSATIPSKVSTSSGVNITQ